MAALGYEYGCVGLRIWLRWVTNMTALGYEYAWQGIRSCVGKEQNLSFHLIAMTAVTLAGFVLGITRTEWTVVILCFGVVIAAELFNTAIERLVDLVSPERHPVAGQVKDIAAGAVLVCAVAAAIIGLIIFIPYL